MINPERNEFGADNAPPKDWFLQFLVNMANKNQFEMEITLSVGGFLISGTLSGVKKYFADFGADLAASFDAGRSSEEIRSTFQKIGDECSCVSNAEPADAPSYIHLKNAIFFSPQGESIRRSHGVWWRGRISEVQGFIPGTLANSVSTREKEKSGVPVMADQQRKG